MEVERVKEDLRKRLKEARYLHSTGVEEVAVDLAYIHGCDPEKADMAGLLHDCARNISEQEMIHECIKYHIPISETEEQCPILLHGKLGAEYAKLRYKVTDCDVLNAIIYHTTGRPNMSLLEKIVFTADFIEPFRKPIPGIDEIRWQAYTNLDHCVLMILESTLKYLQAKKSQIDYLTVETYNYYKAILPETNKI